MSQPQTPDVEMDDSRPNSPLSQLSNQYTITSEQAARLKKLYPYVDLDELPKQWSSKDKANFITLSEDGLKVHYKGIGKTLKDASSVRATHFIPQNCLLYYFEVKIVSKGRDGYMGIGLAAQGVNMHRLPGWDKQSFGYHGDDGNSFNSSGTGQPYGPTFTTGDIIGCGYNLIENNCFYTKNGLNLGVAFTDLPRVHLFPTVGLQTPGEELEANFGISPFCYDIEQDMIALRKRITEHINSFPVNHAEWQPMLHHLVQSWLVHNGYCSTAQVFSECTQIPFIENIQNIKQRLKIQQFVLNGKIGDAIQMTNRLYPSVLKDDPNLLFALKCRQFIEFICGNESLSSTNGNDCNGNSESKMDIDSSPDEPQNSIPNTLNEIIANSNNSVNNNSNDQVEKFKQLLLIGKELNAFSKQLKSEFGYNETNKKMLEEAWLFIAYQNINDADLQVVYLDRETVCQRLNNAIVNISCGSQRVAIETVLKHTKSLIALNSYCGAWILDKL